MNFKESLDELKQDKWQTRTLGAFLKNTEKMCSHSASNNTNYNSVLNAWFWMIYYKRWLRNVYNIILQNNNNSNNVTLTSMNLVLTEASLTLKTPYWQYSGFTAFRKYFTDAQIYCHENPLTKNITNLWIKWNLQIKSWACLSPATSFY